MSDTEDSKPIRPGFYHSQSQKVVAGRTLMALKAVLREAISAPGVPGTSQVLVPLAEHAALGEVGGIVQLPGPGSPIAVARIGRTSYVAYRLSDNLLEELALDYDEAAGAIVVHDHLAT
jgi:hypothetical protein